VPVARTQKEEFAGDGGVARGSFKRASIEGLRCILDGFGFEHVRYGATGRSDRSYFERNLMIVTRSEPSL
jgi:hypothetical protein